MWERFRWRSGTIVIRPHLITHLVLPIVIAVSVGFGFWLAEGPERDPLKKVLLHHIEVEVFVGVSLILISALATNLKLRRNAPDFANAYFELLERALYDLGDYRRGTKTDGHHRLSGTTYLLSVINAQTGKALDFEPDNRAIHLLHDINGLVSVTEARPSEWLNPTYNYFLINNYLTTFAACLNRSGPGPLGIRFANRDDAAFATFRQLHKDILEEIAKLEHPRELVALFAAKPRTLRFYFLSTDEIDSAKSTLELLVAGHELFGCFLYIINRDVLNLRDNTRKDHLRLQAFLQGMEYDYKDNSNTIDFAVGIHTGLQFVSRAGDELTVRQMDQHVDSYGFLASLKLICNTLHAQYNSADLLWNSYDRWTPSQQNDKHCHAYLAPSAPPSGRSVANTKDTRLSEST